MAQPVMKHSGPRGQLIESRSPRPVLSIRPDLTGGEMVERDENRMTRQGEFRLETDSEQQTSVCRGTIYASDSRLVAISWISAFWGSANFFSPSSINVCSSFAKSTFASMSARISAAGFWSIRRE